MRGARREIAVVEIVGLHPVLDEGAHQGRQRLGIVVHALEQHRLADERDAGVGEPRERRAAGGGEFARMVGVERQPGRRRRAGFSAATISSSIRSGATSGTRVCQRRILTCAIAAISRRDRREPTRRQAPADRRR